MQTIIILLHFEKLKNPDLDLCYIIPERIEEVSKGFIEGNGYDFISDDKEAVGIWLKTESALDCYPIIVRLLQEETFKENDLSFAAHIYISENDTEELRNCKMVYPKS